ncbi:UPF0183-domain-containing protein [Hesseltinella vesiculosa]|uniref:UPF0183-domain-containing protein n=1 Tax=Hesseltinella vesiculosa TaxID=101127 RepID=A0A1X2G6J4_9FUNG|nr:UPF0183-domain-containing protein [Hesseltinella vesiculosa]
MTPQRPSIHETKEVKRIELIIVPGKSLGPFRLGLSLWDTIQFLRDKVFFFPKVDLKYDEKEPLRYPVILTLPMNGIHLWFDASLQRLKCIECFDPSKVKLVYQNGDVSSSRTIPTFLSIYKSFGPTYPGDFDEPQCTYTLSYPGVSFAFPIPTKYHDIYKQSNDLPLEFPDGTTPIASKLYVFPSQSPNWVSAALPNISKLLTEIGDGLKYGKWGRRDVEKVVAKVSQGIELHFPSHEGKDEGQHQVDILLGCTTVQEILSDLGRPSRLFYKEEDKMKIHSVDEPSNKSGSSDLNDEDERDIGQRDEATDYFLNYFHLGLDFLIDGSRHVCVKIVLHGNIPGHFDFQRYKRCPYQIILPTKKKNGKKDLPKDMLVDVTSDPKDDQVPNNIITNTMKITTMQQRIPWTTGNQITTKPTDQTQIEQHKPVILTRGSNEQNPFGSTYLTGYSQGIVMEVMKNGDVPSIVLF